MKRLSYIVMLFIMLLMCSMLAGCGSGGGAGKGEAQESGLGGQGTDGNGDVPAMVSAFIKKTHPSPFNKMTEEEFDRGIEALSGEWEALGEEQAYFKLRELVAGLGDSHTMLALPEEMYLPQLPFFAIIYEDRWIVVQAENDYGEIVGKELTAINGIEISQVKDRLLPLVSYETENWADYQCSLEFRYLHSLMAVGVADNLEALSITVRDTVTGEESSLEAAGAEEYDYKNAVMIPLAGTIAQSGNYRGNILEDGTVYIQYNICAEAPDMSMSDFAKAMEEQAFAQTPEKIIVDLRHNGGGNSQVITPLLKLLEKQQQEKGAELYCLTGAETFSSGLMNAIDLKQMGATVVGEATGGVMGFGEVKECALPGGGFIYCSSKDFSSKQWDGIALEPDIEVSQTVEDLLNGVDTAVELIKTGTLSGS